MWHKPVMPPMRFQILRCATPGATAVAARSRQSFARHSHEQFGIGVIDSGAQRWHSGRTEVEAGFEAAIAVNAGEVHDGAPIGDGGRCWRMLYFDPPLVQAAARDLWSGAQGEFEFARPVMPDRRVAMRVRRLLRAETEPRLAGPSPDELFLELLAMVGTRATKGPVAVPCEIALAKARIDDDPGSPAPLAELAEIAGLGRFQLLRGFTRATGLTPHAYLLQRRAELVRRLIARGETLAIAAVGAGFADQSHMTRCFVAKYGFSPGIYAKAFAASRSRR